MTGNGEMTTNGTTAPLSAERAEALYELLGTEHAPAEVRALLPEILNQLAGGVPVENERLAGLPAWRADVWDQLRDWGAHLDEKGRIVGIAGMSIPWTPHRVELQAGRGFHAWCALDTLVLPQILGEDARVQSVCPVTGTSISLEVTGNGEIRHAPPGLTVSVVVPSVEGATDGVCLRPALVGRQGFFCSRVWFFVSREVATRWLASAEGAVLVTPDEGLALGRALWCDPLQTGRASLPGVIPVAKTKG
jgi:alkylmercury lyase